MQTPYPTLPNDILLLILDHIPLETWYYPEQFSLDLQVCHGILNLCLVNKLFKNHVFRRLKAIHTEPKDPELLWDVVAHIVYFGHTGFIKLLLDTGMDVNLQSRKELKHSVSLIYVASLVRQYHIVKLLLDRGADVNAHDDEYPKPLEIAIDENYPEIVELLLPYTNREHIRLAFKHTVWRSRGEVMQVILFSGSIELTEIEKVSAFFHCCAKGDKFSVHNLLDIGVPVAVYNEEAHPPHWTALHAAASSGHGILVSFLLESGADVHVNTPGERSRTPLMVAASAEKVPIYGVRRLLEHGADLHVKDIDGRTALDIAQDRPRRDQMLVDMLVFAGLGVIW